MSGLAVPLRQVVDCQPSSPDRYRYYLRVRLGAGPALTVIQKNPSLADHTRRDPTVGKVEVWARRHGYGLVTYVNLFAYRSPHPVALNATAYSEAVGPENDTWITASIQPDCLLIAAWGNPNGLDPLRYARRIAEVLALLKSLTSRPIHVVGGWTKAGHPRHGLHWNGVASLREWRIGSGEWGCRGDDSPFPTPPNSPAPVRSGSGSREERYIGGGAALARG